MNNLESENVIVAIGVLSVMADDYNNGQTSSPQSGKRTARRYLHLTQKIESIAKEEVQR